MESSIAERGKEEIMNAAIDQNDEFPVGCRVRVVQIVDDDNEPYGSFLFGWSPTASSGDARNIGRIGTITEIILGDWNRDVDYGALYQVRFDDERDSVETQAAMDKENNLPLNHSTHWHVELVSL